MESLFRFLFAVSAPLGFCKAHDSSDQFFGYYFVLQMPGDNVNANGLRGLGFSVIVYLLICSWQLRDSLLVRPHPVVWRVVKGLSFLYLVSLVWLTFQNAATARHVLSYWDPTLGVPLKEQSYAMACELYTPNDPVSKFRNVYNTFYNEEGHWFFMDVFIISHVVGWFCKMIMIRDFRLTMLASMLFECYEMTFKHMLANFAECWWDSLILDFILCNGFGIFLGYWFLRLFNCQQYNFLYSVSVASPDGTSVRRWKPLVSFRYFLTPLILLLSLALIEVNAFFLKFLFWLPAPHHMNLARICFWWMLGCAGTRELYYKMQNPSAPVGMMISLIFVLAALETTLCYKLSAGMFTESMPFHIKAIWTCVLSALFLFAILYYPIQHHKNSGGKEEIVTTTFAEGAAKKEKTN